MSDSRLRELERTARSSGCPTDEAAWLLERVRQGDLTLELLTLAAHCGHAGASVAHAPPDRLDRHRRAPWGLEPRGKRALVRASLECARLLRAAWKARPEEDELLDHALGVVGAWCDAVTGPESFAALRAVHALGRSVRGRSVRWRWLHHGAIVALTQAPLARVGADALRDLARRCAEFGYGPLELRDAVGRGLVAWALRPARSCPVDGVASSGAERRG